MSRVLNRNPRLERYYGYNKIPEMMSIELLWDRFPKSRVSTNKSSSNREFEQILQWDNIPQQIIQN